MQGCLVQAETNGADRPTGLDSTIGIHHDLALTFTKSDELGAP